MKRVLALDFDGLLCSALTESILITWNGYYDKGLADFCDAGLDAIPLEFIVRFISCRNFAKHHGHFFIALLDSLPPIRSQQDFEAVYQSIPPKDIHRFVEKVSRYRALVRQEKRQTWLGYHRLYPGIAHFLRTLTLSVYIVTAKDAASVAAVLEQADVPFIPDHIFGNQQAKIHALQTIQQYEAVRTTDLFFFDDNVFNVLEARRIGYSAFWALWGYNAPDHFTLAQRQYTPTIDLPTFLTNNPAFSQVVLST